MNKEWSELNKLMQTQLKKESTYKIGIDTLFELRNQLMNILLSFQQDLNREEFNAMPFIKANGYHNKSILYSIWHIFRIEDIVVHSLMSDHPQIFFSNNYDKRIVSPIITTGNELKGIEIGNFSKQLNLPELYMYIKEVKEDSEKLLRGLSYKDLKRKIPEEKKDYLKSLNVVSDDESAAWLIDYWCGKDLKGLIQMPLSRHWIMHIDACLRIKESKRNSKRCNKL